MVVFTALSSAVLVAEASAAGAATPAPSEGGCTGSGRTGVSTLSAGAVSPFCGADSTGLASTGAASDGAAADWRSFSRFFSSVRKKALSVVRRALLGLQRSGETGVCVQTGHVSEREAWPRRDNLSILGINRGFGKISTYRSHMWIGHSRGDGRRSRLNCCKWRISA